MWVVHDGGEDEFFEFFRGEVATSFEIIGVFAEGGEKIGFSILFPSF